MDDNKYTDPVDWAEQHKSNPGGDPTQQNHAAIGHQLEQPNTPNNANNINKIILIIAGTVLVILVIVIGFFVLSSESERDESSEQENTESLIENHGTNADAAKDTSNETEVDTPPSTDNEDENNYYLPQRISVENSQLSLGSAEGAYSLTYSSGIEFGQGITNGSYIFYVYTNDQYYNPPADCGIPGGLGPAGGMKCSAYQASSNGLQAYIYEGFPPFVIQNTEATNPFVMYAKKGSAIIAIATAGTTPADIYKIIQDMELVGRDELPSGTVILEQ